MWRNKKESNEYLWMLLTRHSASLDSCGTEPQWHIRLQLIFFPTLVRKKKKKIKFLLCDYNSETQKCPLLIFLTKQRSILAVLSASPLVSMESVHNAGFTRSHTKQAAILP